MAGSPDLEPAPTSDLPYRVQIDGEDDGDVVATVVEALAAVRSVDPVDLDIRLAEHVEIDALERLYRHSKGRPEDPWRVQFDVGGHAVSVRSDGLVSIT